MDCKLKTGDRIRLLSMPMDPDPIPIGTCGTVLQVNNQSDWTLVEVAWDNGRTLMLASPPDQFEIISGDT